MVSLIDEFRSGKLSIKTLSKRLKIPRCNICDQIDPILDSYVNIASVKGYAISTSSIKASNISDYKPETIFEIIRGTKVSKNKAVKINIGALIPKGANAVINLNDKNIMDDDKAKCTEENETKIKLYGPVEKYKNIKSKSKTPRIIFDDSTVRFYDLKGDPKKESRKNSYIKDHPKCSRCGTFFNGTHSGGKEEEACNYRMISTIPRAFYCECEKCSTGHKLCVWCAGIDKSHKIKIKRRK
jgi:hypothetical protein